MSIIAKCPSCGAEYDASEYAPGDQFQCVDCGALVTVPGQQAASGKKLTIGDRSRIGSGIKKKSVNRRPVKPRTGQMRGGAARRGGAPKQRSARPASASRPASGSRERAPQPPALKSEAAGEDQEYSVEPRSNAKKLILIFSGLAVIAIVLVVVLFVLNKQEPGTSTTDGDGSKVTKDEEKPPVKSTKEDEEIVEPPKEEVKKPKEEEKEPPKPVEITRSEEYLNFINGFFKEVVEAKVDDSDYMETLERIAKDTIKSEIIEIMRVYASNPELKCPDDYFFSGLFSTAMNKVIEDYTSCIELLNNEVTWKYNDLTYYAYFKRGEEYFRDRDATEKAIADLTVVIEKEPTFAPGYYYRAKAYFRNKQYNECYWDIDEAVKNDAEYDKYRDLKDMKRTCFSNGARPKVSVEDLNKAVEDDAENPIVYFNRANYYLNKKEYEKAEADYTKGLELLVTKNIKLRPSDDREIRRARIICWREMGQLEKALEGITDLLKKYMEDPMLIATKGLILLKMKKYREALVDLEYAQELEAERGGSALAKSQQIIDAIKECKEGIAKEKESGDESDDESSDETENESEGEDDKDTVGEDE